MSLTRPAVVIACAFLVLNSAPVWADNAENVQLECDVSNDGILITTGNVKHSMSDGTASNRRMFDIGMDGISFHVAPLVYAKELPQLSFVEYADLIPDNHGLMSIAVKDEGGYVEIVGVIDRACWVALQQFISVNKVPLMLRETTKQKK